MEIIDFNRAGQDGFRAGRRFDDDVRNAVERRGSFDAINAVRKLNNDGVSVLIVRLLRPTLRDLKRFGERRDRVVARTVGGVVSVRRDENRSFLRGVQRF